MDNYNNNYDCIIGIDPGSNGGLAVEADGHISVCKMPKNITQLGEFLKHYRDNYHNVIVFIEKLAIRHDDLQGGKVFRIKKLIANHEQLKLIVALHSLPYAEVHPLTWQSRLGLRQVGEEKSARKKRYKDVASGLYPSVNTTMWNCDALLIMRYGKTMLESNVRRDTNWMRDNIVINKNNDIYNNIY